jgi:hypothetical protein
MEAVQLAPLTASLADLGRDFDALSRTFRHVSAECDAVIAESEKAMAFDGIAYGSREWSNRRFAECGADIRKANELRAELEDLTHEISNHPAFSLADLLIKAKARLFDATPEEILSDIQQLINVAKAHG